MVVAVRGQEPGRLTVMAAAWAAGRPSPVLAAWILIAAYGLLVALRTLMLGYNDYTRYQAPVALIAWVALAWRWLPAWLGERPGRPAAMGALAGVALVLGGQPALAELVRYAGPHEPVTGAVGTVMAETAFARPFNGALAYLRAHLRPGEAIDTSLDAARVPNLLPPGSGTPLLSPVRPQPQFSTSGYFIQGISFGLMYRW